ncbi:hypothetical protein, partial [Enterobacter oligotrophicus]|uniref:hypothetical protein n=1 Tax=Enterobacter oligotrophicus TaxID=2478464 RepID=UPI0023F3FA1C
DSSDAILRKDYRLFANISAINNYLHQFICFFNSCYCQQSSNAIFTNDGSSVNQHSKRRRCR